MNNLTEKIDYFKFEILTVISLLITVILLDLAEGLESAVGFYWSGTTTEVGWELNSGISDPNWFIPIFLTISVCVLMISLFMVIGKYLDKIFEFWQTRNRPETEENPNIFLEDVRKNKNHTEG